jgi:pimeloyl-ACP methyl ester carboxylesterase
VAENILGPLYYERMGRTGPAMAFVHPNPMDQSCWIYQMAHLSTWFRCVAIDLPGYGRSPRAEAGLTLTDMAQACWEALDEALRGESAILVGCSVGSSIIQQMYHLRPSKTLALILSGTGYHAPGTKPAFVVGRIQEYGEEGLAYRWRYAFQDMSPAFRATPLAHYFAQLFTERNDLADLQSIIYQFEALGAPRPEHFYAGIECPTIILTGTEDPVHAQSLVLKQMIPRCELRVLPGAGHACHMEQPWLFDGFLIEFLEMHGLFPGKATVARLEK